MRSKSQREARSQRIPPGARPSQGKDENCRGCAEDAIGCEQGRDHGQDLVATERSPPGRSLPEKIGHRLNALQTNRAARAFRAFPASLRQGSDGGARAMARRRGRRWHGWRECGRDGRERRPTRRRSLEYQTAITGKGGDGGTGAAGGDPCKAHDIGAICESIRDGVRVASGATGPPGPASAPPGLPSLSPRATAPPPSQAAARTTTSPISRAGRFSTCRTPVPRYGIANRARSSAIKPPSFTHVRDI